MIAKPNDDAQTKDIDATKAKAILDERARELAKSSATDDSIDDSLNLMLFAIAGQEFAIETKYIQEVTAAKSITPLPTEQSFVVGLTNLRGEVTAVFDLRSIFDIRAELVDDPKLVVIGLTKAEFCVLVDRLSEVKTLNPDDLALPPGFQGPGRDYLKGVTSQALLVLDGARMLADDRLYVDEE